MKFGQVVGTVVCVQRDPGLEGTKLLIVQPLDAKLVDEGSLYVAADGSGQAGEGDIVVVVFRGDAPNVFEREWVPVDASIVGFVDDKTVQSLRGCSHS